MCRDTTDCFVSSKNILSAEENVKREKKNVPTTCELINFRASFTLSNSLHIVRYYNIIIMPTAVNYVRCTRRNFSLLVIYYSHNFAKLYLNLSLSICCSSTLRRRYLQTKLVNCLLICCFLLCS